MEILELPCEPCNKLPLFTFSKELPQNMARSSLDEYLCNKQEVWKCTLSLRQILLLFKMKNALAIRKATATIFFFNSWPSDRDRVNRWVGSKWRPVVTDSTRRKQWDLCFHTEGQWYSLLITETLWSTRVAAGMNLIRTKCVLLLVTIHIVWHTYIYVVIIRL
jgi:hypothetical protein